jgi:phosphoribosylanthranilate isomerase
MHKAWDLSSVHTRVKLCEFESLDAAYEASFLGADLLGFHIFKEQEYCAKAHADAGYRAKAEKFAKIFADLPDTVGKCLLTDLDEPELFEVLGLVSFDSIQLYNHVSREELAELRRRAGEGVRIIKLMSEKSVENGCDDDTFIRRYEDLVDAFLLDSSWLGGTGVKGDWEHCAAIVAKCSVPVFLAGGLTADNVREAIAKVRPFGVDVENGVSNRLRDGTKVKNMMKCRLFVEKVREADWLVGKTGA